MKYNFSKSRCLLVGLLFAGVSSLNAIEVAKVKNTTVEVYGGAGISIVSYSDGELGPVVENESKVGFRASTDIGDGMSTIMQIESGTVGHDGTKLGNRDTFVGIKGNFGKVRIGRMLTPMYQIVDWPYSNPGLGRVFDWGGAVGANYDRQSNMIRFDGAKIGPISYSLAGGRNGGKAVKDGYFYGASVNYPVISMLTLNVGVESATKFRGKDDDTLGYIVGFESSMSGFGLVGAYKSANSKPEEGDEKSQNLLSVVTSYTNKAVQLKLGYAKSNNSKVGDEEMKDSKNIMSVQALYFMSGGPVAYVRVAMFDSENEEVDENTIVRLGMEFGF